MAAVSAREVALKALREIDEKGAYAAPALEGALERHPLGKLDRSLATELVYGTSRRLNTIDWVIGKHSSRPVAQMTVWIRNILRMAAYQLLFTDKIPASAAVNEAVELAKRYGHAGTAKFVNGVLRAIVRSLGELSFPDPEKELVEHLALRYSHPEWMIRRWLERYGPEATAALCRANNTTPATSVRVNRLKATREEVLEALAREGVSAAPSPVTPEGLIISGYPSIGRLRAFREGLFTVQDESSMLVAPALAPKPGETVIDACAAPGGKTTHLAEIMENRGKIIAADVHEHKLPLIREACARLGIDIVKTILADARELGGLFPSQADKVLVDAPCSGLGVLRRRPDARWRKGPEQIEELRTAQAEILEGAARCLKPGGALIYSTCSIEPEENLEVVQAFLAQHPEFTLDNLWPFVPVGFWREESLEKGYLQLLPHAHGTDGFFIARLTKGPLSQKQKELTGPEANNA